MTILLIHPNFYFIVLDRKKRSPEFQDALYTLDKPPYYWDDEVEDYDTATKNKATRYIAGML